MSAQIKPVTSSLEGPLTLKQWLRLILIVMSFNAVIAVCLKLSQVTTDPFRGLMIYSQCIGLSIFLSHALLAFLPLPASRALGVMVRIVVAAPLGYVIGAKIAALIVGDPSDEPLFVDVPPFQLVVTAIASVCVVYFLWSRDRLQEEMAAHARAEQLASEAQLRLLRAQIEPHMLFNTLANLRSLVESDSVRAQHMLDQLIVFLRGTLSASRLESRSLEAESEQLRAYLDLMKIRMADRLEYQLDVDENLQGLLVPAMLIQPLLENAIKHGLEPAIAGGSLNVSAKADGASLRIVVEDTGVGLGEHVADGYGLTHIRQRLAALYGEKARFAIDATLPHGVRASIWLPLSEVVA